MSRFPAPRELITTACLLLLFAVSPPVLAAPAIYDVEVVVFSYSGAANSSERRVSPTGRSSSGGAFRQGQFTELDRSQYQLDGIRNALRQSSGYRVLFHRAWRQSATGRDTAVAYPVSSLVTGGSRSVEGSIRLVLERYLHLDVNLVQMSARGAGGPGSVPVHELREKRRIRSGELHYFDHPRFGMVAKVTPYSVPEAVVEAEPAPEPPAAVEEPPPAAVDDQLTR